ncbi:thiosulfate oxidation carrier protein SoxY [Methylobacillus arboreus]|uniref:thiosulfate oxidation carrier protein SoxY n=1 Tax=Methylobacillus arboreus TaxID=755170 RepID=UPI001E62AAE7|nr:thiosulfate oxidation carrier protein SoxY [Methylobacillus arboreus]MCB5190227.1 thiosulfate oxidation carrier protein SoxY [Methylobacillus arboreus]
MNLRLKPGRRTLLQLVSALLLTPWQAWAAIWNKPAFEMDNADVAGQELQGNSATHSREIEIVAPKSVAHGEAAQIEIMSRIAGTEAIAIFAEKNPVPLVANFTFSHGAQPYIVTRIKLAGSQKVEAVVKAGGQYYQASRYIRVRKGTAG